MKLTPLSFWMDGPNTKTLVRLYQRWWNQLLDWILWPQKQIDIDTASLNIVDVIAWQRSVNRLPTEPEWLYRRRVKYAKANANDSASVAGFKRIWRRLGLGELAIKERIEGRDWDIIQLEVPETSLSDNAELLQELITMYGRTCRRYEYSTISSIVLYFKAPAYSLDYRYSKATME